ncbi:MAG: hypothetical protein JXA73_08600 [Acidobacteria bacterium]|nr:hypothetical protein [Acidobacteriota bacterium]
MRRLIDMTVDEIMPTATEVLENQGMAGRPNMPARILTLLDSALELFRELAKPRGLMEDLPKSNFEPIYNGNGLNDPDCPVPPIVAQADALALFAATMGPALAARSSDLFTRGGPALGFMLDAVNSAGAERLGQTMCRNFLELQPEELCKGRQLKVQYYCPGHCGWHLSGQEIVFETLHPEEIGITLTPSWAMNPVKSISGVLVAGGIETHRFRPNFPFCKNCREHKCVSRLRLLESMN